MSKFLTSDEIDMTAPLMTAGFRNGEINQSTFLEWAVSLSICVFLELTHSNIRVGRKHLPLNCGFKEAFLIMV